MSGISKEKLIKWYVHEKMSANEIADDLDCSQNKVNYWIKKHGIEKRSISEAMYVKNNPDGDPFESPEITNTDDAFLYGLGLGLYWGEGTKSDEHAVRLGNTDPNLIKAFIRFLERIYSVDKSRLRFGLQIFSEMDKREAKAFWVNHLNVSDDQFWKVVKTPSRGKGTYRKKVEHGVLTIYFSNVKLRNMICEKIKNL